MKLKEKCTGQADSLLCNDYFVIANDTPSLSLYLAKGIAQVYCGTSLEPACIDMFDRIVQVATHAKVRRTMQFL